MAFSQATISNVLVALDGTELFVSWSSTATSGTCYQVYVNRTLAWWGRSTRCHVVRPAAPSGRNIWIDVASVNPDEVALDFSADLPTPTGMSTRAQLTWNGGTYLDPTGNDDISGFLIYASDAPAGSVDYSTVVATVPAYQGGWISDGFGLGGFGTGGFGRVATQYQWESDSLASGVWQFAIVPYDVAGNLRQPGQIASVTINEAPLPPAPASDGTLLSYQYSGPSTKLVTLNWLPSPSQG